MLCFTLSLAEACVAVFEARTSAKKALAPVSHREARWSVALERGAELEQLELLELAVH